jgi:membrane protein
MNDSVASVFALFTQALKRLFADEAIPLAGNIAFRIVFSIFPFLIFLTTLAGFFGSEALAEQVVTYLLSVAPEQLVRPISGEIRAILTVPRTGLLSLSALLTIWSAMAGVDSVRVGLNRAYDLKDTRPFWFLYIQNVLFIIGAAILLLVVALLIVVYPVALVAIEKYAPTQLANFASIDRLRYPLAMLLLLAGLLFAHRILPAQSLPIRHLLPGVIITVLVWIGLSAAFSIYLQHFNSFASTYASLSGLFAAMFFIYQAALVLIFGGEMNRVISLLRLTPDFPPTRSPQSD